MLTYKDSHTQGLSVESVHAPRDAVVPRPAQQ